MTQDAAPVLLPLHKRTFTNPDLVLKTCEAPGCAEQRERRHCFSFIVSMLHVHLEEQHAASGQCEQEQHWCCSHDHALLAAATCIDEHHHMGMLKPHPPSAPLPMPDTDVCEVCHTPLSIEAFHMAICYATPGFGYAAYNCGTDYAFSEEELMQMYGPLTPEQRAVVPLSVRIPNEHWCCSEECAKRATHACMHEHLSGGKHG